EDGGPEEVIAAGLAVEASDRAAELAGDEHDRLVEERLSRRLTGRRLEVGEERAERGIERLALRVDAVAGRAVDVAVVVPAVERDLHEAGAAAAREDLLRDEAGV